MMGQSTGRAGKLNPEQVKAIYAGIIEAAAQGAVTAARLSEMAWELAGALEADAPDLPGSLKPIDALIRASNVALRLPLALFNAGVIPFPPLASALDPSPIPITPVVLACLPPLAPTG